MGVIGLGLALQADAASDQYVYITGSTAARAVTYTALTAPGEVFSSAPVAVLQGSSTASSCTYMAFTGHLQGEAGSLVTTIKCYWSGSEAGIADLNTPTTTESFLDDTAVTSSSSPGPFVPHTVDLCMADNAVTYSQNPKAAITGAKVCVVPFVWVAEKGSSTNLTGVNEIALRNALKGGCKVIQFPPFANDLTFVYVSGRDVLSGTRCNTFGISGFGINSSPKQLQINSAGSMITQGDGNILEDVGYSSGGSLATQIGYDVSKGTGNQVDGTGNPFSVITYLGIPDAATAIFNGGTLLTYDGVPYSIANVVNGTYPFWGYEYVCKKNSGESTAGNEVYTLLSTGISNHADDLVSTKTGNQQVVVKLTDMQATRTGPTTDPVHK